MTYIVRFLRSFTARGRGSVSGEPAKGIRLISSRVTKLSQRNNKNTCLTFVKHSFILLHVNPYVTLENVHTKILRSKVQNLPRTLYKFFTFSSQTKFLREREVLGFFYLLWEIPVCFSQLDPTYFSSKGIPQPLPTLK